MISSESGSFAAITMGFWLSFTDSLMNSTAPMSALPASPSTSSRKISDLSPKRLTVTIASPILFCSLSLVRTSLALRSTRFIPRDFASRFTKVVFPVPGGPTRRAAFVPGFHFESQTASASRASSFPISWSGFFGLYFSDHMPQNAPPMKTISPTSIPISAVFLTESAPFTSGCVTIL